MKSIFAFLVAVSLAPVMVAQSINILPERKPTHLALDGSAPTEYAVPAGANAGTAASGEDDSNAGAVLGLQVWKKDVSFLSAFFTLSGGKTISGGHTAFGSAFLNPRDNFSVSGSRVLLTRDAVHLGVAGRAGVSQTTWSASVAGQNESHDGSIIYGVLGGQITGPTIQVAGGNEYQMGGEVGLGVRGLGGDLAQARTFRKSAAVLGTDKKSFVGVEATFFLRLNSIQPFVRISDYPSGTDVSGLSGLQAYFGVNMLSSLFRGEFK